MILVMEEIIREIRRQLGVSQEDLAKMTGVSFATVNRWENGHSSPGRAVQLRLYDVCVANGVKLDKIISRKISNAAADAGEKPDSLILYHGSRYGIQGKIAPISRERCDFGRGFYMGTDPYQPLTLISDFDESRFYVVHLDLSGLRVNKLEPDIDWALMVAYNRGKMDGIRGTELYRRYAAISGEYDVITGCIADDRMFYVLDNFFQGNITDKALVMSMSSLELGQQYVAVTEKACSQISIEAEIELSYLEKLFLSDLSDANRKKGVALAREICKEYRREGRFFDEILSDAAEGRFFDEILSDAAEGGAADNGAAVTNTSDPDTSEQDTAIPDTAKQDTAK